MVLLTTHEALPHPELLMKAAKGGLLVTVALAVFTVMVRLAGGAVAAFMEKSLGVFSSKLGLAVGDKIRTFRAGPGHHALVRRLWRRDAAVAGHVAASSRWLIWRRRARSWPAHNWLP